MAERVGFEPTCPLLAGKTLSRRPRYDRFGTSPAKWKIETRKRLSQLLGISSPLPEELAQNFCALIGQHAGNKFDPMIHFGVVEDCQG